MPALPPLTFEIADELRFILDLGVAVALALVGGMLAVRLRQPPIVGYLLAGVVIGPFTPGFVGDAGSINELAEIGVVLLLFALGVEFSLRELAPVRRVAVPGAILQVAHHRRRGCARRDPARAERDRRRSSSGRPWRSAPPSSCSRCSRSGASSTASTAGPPIGWMVVQDLVTILLIALLEPFAEGGDLAGPVAVHAAADRAVPRARVRRRHAACCRGCSGRSRRLGSPELFLLTVFATALLAAFLSARRCSACSLALGAFVAGLIVSESEL